MNLAMILNQTEIHVLRTIVKQHGLSCRLHSKYDLIQTILEHFQNHSFVLERLTKLQTMQQQLLIRLTLDHRQQFTREDLAVAAEKALGDKIGKRGPEALWTELMDLGWIFRTGNSIYNYVFHIPDDLKPVIKQWVASYLAQKVKYTEFEPPYYRADGFAMLRDLERFLQFVEQNDVRLTQDGTIFKRTQQQLFQLFEIQEPPLAGNQWRFGYGRRFRDYPDRFALVYDFCFAKGWIVEESDGTLHSGLPETDWAVKSDMDKVTDLYLFWEKTYSRPISQLHLSVSFLAYACKNKWTYIESIESVLKPYIEKYYYDTVETIIRERIIRMLRYLGLVQTGGSGNEEEAIVLTNNGKVLFFHEEYKPSEFMPAHDFQSQLLVQPNLEILVGTEARTDIDREIHRFAELTQTGPVRCYRLTEDSVKRYVKSGHPPEQLLSFLQKNSSGELPSAVRQRVKQWADGFGKIRTFQATLLECEDEQVREEILNIPGIMNFVEEVIGDRYVLIRKTHVQEFLVRLEQFGRLVLHEPYTEARDQKPETRVFQGG